MDAAVVFAAVVARVGRFTFWPSEADPTPFVTIGGFREASGRASSDNLHKQASCRHIMNERRRSEERHLLPLPPVVGIFPGGQIGG